MDYYLLNFIFKIEIKKLEFYSINYLFIKFEMLSWIITKDFYGLTVYHGLLGRDLKHEPHDGKVREYISHY